MRHALTNKLTNICTFVISQWKRFPTCRKWISIWTQPHNYLLTEQKSWCMDAHFFCSSHCASGLLSLCTVIYYRTLCPVCCIRGQIICPLWHFTLLHITLLNVYWHICPVDKGHSRQPLWRQICFHTSFTSLPNDLSPKGPAAVGVAHKIRRAVLATAAGRVGGDCPIVCTSSVQLVTLVTSFNASDFSH